MKIFLGLFLIVSCGYIAKMYASKYTDAKNFYLDFYQFNRALINKVSYSNQGIIDLVNQINKNTPFYTCISEYFNNKNPKITCKFLSDANIEQFNIYLQEIGKSDRTAEISYLNSADKEIGEFLKNATETEKKYKPLCIKLGVLMGLIIFVIII